MAFSVGFVHEVMEQDEHRVAADASAIYSVKSAMGREGTAGRRRKGTHLMIVPAAACPLLYLYDEAPWAPSSCEYSKLGNMLIVNAQTRVASERYDEALQVRLGRSFCKSRLLFWSVVLEKPRCFCKRAILSTSSTLLISLADSLLGGADIEGRRPRPGSQYT